MEHARCAVKRLLSSVSQYEVNVIKLGRRNGKKGSCKISYDAASSPT